MSSRITLRIEIVCCCLQKISNGYPDKEVPNKTKVRLITKFRNTESVCDRKYILRRRVLTYETIHNVEETRTTRFSFYIDDTKAYKYYST
jgi:hypothetical protein